MRECRRCNEAVAEGRQHPIERCITVLRYRLYREQIENLMLRRRIRELEKRNDVG